MAATAAEQQQGGQRYERGGMAACTILSPEAMAYCTMQEDLGLTNCLFDNGGSVYGSPGGTGSTAAATSSSSSSSSSLAGSGAPWRSNTAREKAVSVAKLLRARGFGDEDRDGYPLSFLQRGAAAPAAQPAPAAWQALPRGDWQPRESASLSSTGEARTEYGAAFPRSFLQREEAAPAALPASPARLARPKGKQQRLPASSGDSGKGLDTALQQLRETVQLLEDIRRLVKDKPAAADSAGAEQQQGQRAQGRRGNLQVHVPILGKEVHVGEFRVVSYPNGLPPRRRNPPSDRRGTADRAPPPPRSPRRWPPPSASRCSSASWRGRC